MLPGDVFRKPVSRFTQDYRIGVYLANDMITQYVHNPGIVQMPASGKGACKFLRWSAPFGGKVVSFVVARLGLMPKYPAPEKDDQNLVFLGGDVQVMAPAIDLDGSTQIFAVSGWYAYGFKQKLVRAGDSLPMGSLVIDATPPAQNVLPAAAAVKRF